MTHDEAMAGGITSHARAIAEIKNHHANVEEFYADLGKRAEYNTREVMLWLGY